MSMSKIIAASILGFSFTAISATSAQALTVRQSQEFSSSTNVKVEGGSDVKAEAESNSWGKQSQRVTTEDTPTYSYRRHSQRPVWVRSAAHGEVHLTWDHRGGTCHVRYTEAGSAGYNYHTSTNCDEGHITIGGLVSGKSYRFQVQKDDGAWSRARTVRAW